MSKQESVIVLGGGIAGLTAAALLAHEGIPTILLEAHYQVGGCAGTFRRGQYIFDVGATQVAGLEIGGIHERLFRHLKSPLPLAEVLDPGCLVDLNDGSTPINLWYETKKWQKEREQQFPGSKSFWDLCDYLHKSNWSIAVRDPVLPIRNFWDLIQLVKAMRVTNLPSSFFSILSVTDLLKICGCDQDERLKKFLNMQLKLYSQTTADCTAALYGATVLQMAQAPLGLWHLKGSMQNLSDQLKSCFMRDQGQLLLRHRVTRLIPGSHQTPWIVEAVNQKGKVLKFQALDVICSFPPQALLEIMSIDYGMPRSFQNRLRNLNKPTGALVFYGVINRIALSADTPSHIQLASKNFGSIFISISRDGDGRAPIGQATLIASIFAEVDYWTSLNDGNYQEQKRITLSLIVEELNRYFQLSLEDWRHQELATPRSFERWTGRPRGIVGGLGQYPFNFGLFGLPSRTPLQGLWLCGDSIYPGEGTAGVSQSAFMACRQLMASRNNRKLSLET